MKKYSILTVFLVITLAANAQFGVSYHLLHSNVSFNYQFNDKFLPEVRLSTNESFEYLDIEAIFSYVFYSNSTVDTYLGAGISTAGVDVNALIPIGLNIYTFEQKNFGFLLEISPILGSPAYLRGDVDIRYRFIKSNESQ